MHRIRWQAEGEETESLALAVRAVLVGAAPPTYAELVGLLGLGSLVVAVPGECLGWWEAHARDAALPSAARLLGLRLRPLHPAEAAEGLDRAPEYAQHFRDSYLPLMRAALEAGQPLLAWRGWPAPAEREWGVLAELRNGEPTGHTLGIPGTVALAGPAHQVYVVEDRSDLPPERRSPTTRWEHAVSVARAAWEHRLPVADGVLTGEPAYRAWHDASLKEHACERCGEESWRCQVRRGRRLAAARRCLAAWLESLAPELSGPAAALAADWARTCGQVADRIEQAVEEPRWPSQLATEAGRQAFARVIAEVQQGEAGIMSRLGGAAPG